MTAHPDFTQIAFDEPAPPTAPARPAAAAPSWMTGEQIAVPPVCAPADLAAIECLVEAFVGRVSSNVDSS